MPASTAERTASFDGSSKQTRSPALFRPRRVTALSKTDGAGSRLSQHPFSREEVVRRQAAALSPGVPGRYYYNELITCDCRASQMIIFDRPLDKS
jgi:hypothetical protein